MSIPRIVASLLVLTAAFVLAATEPVAAQCTTTVADGGDSGAATLRDAIACAPDGGTVTFESSLTSVSITSDDLTVADKAVTIDGGETGVVVDFGGNPYAFVVQDAGGLTLRRLTVTGAQATALVAEAGSDLAVDSCLFADNGHVDPDIGEGLGGALRLLGDGSETTPVTIDNSTFYENTAAHGIDHAFTAYGGAVYADGRDVEISFSTFYGNRVVTDVESGSLYAANDAVITSRASVYYFNGCLEDDATGGAIVSAGANVYYNDNAGSSCPPFDETGDDDVVIADLQTNFSPVLSLDDYGGPTQTMAPGHGSPALDLADDCLGVSHAPAGDGRGLVRPASGCDAGAVEAIATFAPENVIFDTIYNGKSDDETITAHAHRDDVVIGVYGTPDDFALPETDCPNTNPQSAGDSCTFRLQATPPDDITRIDVYTVEVVHGDDTPDAFSYTRALPLTAGAGLPVIALVGSPDTPSAAVGRAHTNFSSAIHNVGPDLDQLYQPAPLTIDDISFSGAAAGDFSLGSLHDGLPIVLRAGGVVLDFRPADFGERTATVTVTSDDPDNPTFEFEITGTATGSGLVLADHTIDFGAVQAGTTETRTLSPANDEDAVDDLTVDASLDAGHHGVFSMIDDCSDENGDPLALPPGASCDVTVTLDLTTRDVTPGDDEAYSGTITLTTNDAANPAVDVNLSAVGHAPSQAEALSLSPGSFDFGTIRTDASFEASVLVTNGGTSAVAIGDLRLSGDTAGLNILENSCEHRDLAPAGQCLLRASYTPAVAGTFSGTVTLNLANGESIDIPFSATGEAAPTSEGDGDGGGCAAGAGGSDPMLLLAIAGLAAVRLRRRSRCSPAP
ncbi:MAG: choice-of-anchor D domain-containing protein [Myxococcota bacterium]